MGDSLVARSSAPPQITVVTWKPWHMGARVIADVALRCPKAMARDEPWHSLCPRRPKDANAKANARLATAKAAPGTASRQNSIIYAVCRDCHSAAFAHGFRQRAKRSSRVGDPRAPIGRPSVAGRRRHDRRGVDRHIWRHDALFQLSRRARAHPVSRLPVFRGNINEHGLDPLRFVAGIVDDVAVGAF
jgi:hypothetical protein